MAPRDSSAGAFATLLTVLIVGGLSAGVDASAEDLLDESFEQVFPSQPWRAEHPPGAADVDWGRTTFRASDGRFSIYCAGIGPAAPGDGGPAPASTASWTVVGPFDLSETTAARLTFDLWLRTERFQDVFLWLVSTDGVSFSGSARSTDTNAWETVTTDLAHWGAAGSVIGEATVWIAFVYQSDQSGLFEGAYLDGVRLAVDSGSTGDQGVTYTSDADFATGTMVGVESTANRLELTDAWAALPYVWVPNTATGTVSRLSTVSGDELASYATGPNEDVDPAVVAVDLDGACWVGNRGAGTVVKIGLDENGGCVDRDGDGEIETSIDRNQDGSIRGSERLAWGDDECVLVEVVLTRHREGPNVPGVAHDDYESNNLQAVAVTGDGKVWAGVDDSRLLYLVDGAGGEVLDRVDLADEVASLTAVAVDRRGTVWLSSWPDPRVLAFDPETDEITRVDLNYRSNGITVGGGDSLYVTGYEDQSLTRVNTATRTWEWDQIAGWQASGVATTSDGRIWVAEPGQGTVSVYTPQGFQASQLPLVGAPTGVAVDQDGRIWVLGATTDSVFRVDPALLRTDLQTVIADSGGHRATGDLTGIVARNVTSRFGSWNVVHDSGGAATPWGRVTWQGSEPDGTAITVRVRSSEDRERWSIWEPAGNGQDLAITPPGRYLEIQAALQRLSGTGLPRLDELTLMPAAALTAPAASFTWSPDEPTSDQPVQFTDTSTGEPTSWVWDFGDGAGSEQQSPVHTFAAAGSFVVSLTAGNGAGTDTVAQTIEIGPEASCSVSCSAVVPATGEVNEPVTFEAVASATACVGDIVYSWDFGDGSTSSEQSPSHTYSATGTLRWQLTATIDDASCDRSGDITISGAGPAACTSTSWVPVASRSDGADGSVWRTDLGLLGVDVQGAAVELRLHTDAAVERRVVTVAPLAMVNLVDVVGWIAPGFSGSGALELCADGAVVVTSRTYNALAPDNECFPGGTFGQFLAGDTSDKGLSAGKQAWLAQLRESEWFRTNIGLVNTGDEPATVEIHLRDASGSELADFRIELAPGQWVQENRPLFRRAGRSDLDAASASVAVVSGGGVFAYASVIDNLTNDATTVPMRR